MLEEIEIRKSYLNNEPVETIYFGGGTPSFIGSRAIQQVIESTYKTFNVADDAEITLECNPDDLNKKTLHEFYSIGVNRLSIGIQSFNDKYLQMMNRAHNSTEAIDSIKLSQDLGFSNITADLIYGIPGTNLTTWQEELEIFKGLKIPHLSAYCLTIEPQTFFGVEYKKGNLKTIDDEDSIAQFEFLMKWAQENEFDHYEISNFAKADKISKHNSAYWQDKSYLGIGPSAHSYNGIERRWNVSNNHTYINNIKAKQPIAEYELLRLSDKCNDYILTGLRTKWGINLDTLTKLAGEKFQTIRDIIKTSEKNGLIKMNGQVCTLTNKGKLQADRIAADLFV